ncbi:MAG TPA: hypothetical protein VGN11_12760 [Candidatus Baltobacteraceae bacterium]|jgi:hypothetical protein|nr:hypothetical protein [Candidatus Baltobacteraceae bacterium]
MSDTKQKPQPFQRHEDQGPAQIYVDAEPWETTPGPSEDEKKHSRKKVLDEHTTKTEHRK